MAQNCSDDLGPRNPNDAKKGIPKEPWGCILDASGNFQEHLAAILEVQGRPISGRRALRSRYKIPT